MDNLTHALVGFISAELAARARARRGEDVSGWVRPAYLTAALANNLPDFDFLYAGITEGKLGYLLHHRGHTHTLAVAIPLATLAYVAGLIWLRRSRPGADLADRLWLGALAFAGPVLHIAMDGSNSYGVHPFWPVWNGWVYGDTVFIIEPLFWVTTLPLLIANVRWRIGRVLLGLWMVAALGLPWLTSFVAPLAASGVLVVAAAVSLATWRSSANTRAAVALGSALGVLAVLVLSHRLAERRMQASLSRDFPLARTHDIVLSALPANPLCWSFLAIQTEAENFVVRRGTASLAPALITAERCARPDPTGTAPMSSVGVAPRPELGYRTQYVAPLAELRTLAREDCHFAALLRFARVPFWKEDGTELVAGDIRYDRGTDLGFAELEIPRPPAPCPRFVPPWIPPRQELID